MEDDEGKREETDGFLEVNSFIIIRRDKSGGVNCKACKREPKKKWESR